MALPLSIIIPTLNEEKYLPNLLQSIRDNTAQPAEIIIADSNSTDKTREIATSFGCKIVPGGNKVTAARNAGAKAATQPILLFFDSDGVLPKQFLEKNIAEFQERGLGVGSCFVTPDRHTLLDRFGAWLSNEYYRLTEHIRPHGYGCCMFATKEVHDAIGGFDEEIVLAEDQDYMLRGAKRGKFGLLRSEKILTSSRRFTEEGRLYTTYKYLYMEIHVLFFGRITKYPFAYSWGKHD